MNRSKTSIVKQKVKIWNAKLWYHIYRMQNLALILKRRHVVLVLTILFIGLIAASAFFTPIFQGEVDRYFTSDDRFVRLQTLLLTLGGSLIGATAIVFSLIMFAIQVNIERMPYGLFRKVNSDTKLLGAFGTTFLLAIVVASSSLIPDRSWATAALLVTCWAILLILVLFLYAYKRALKLISPTNQLAFVVTDIKKSLNTWVRRALRAAPFLEDTGLAINIDNSRLVSNHDVSRARYFQLNPNWTEAARQGVLHAITFARRYSEQGDHEVSRFALDAVVAINAAYIKAKGKTFYAHNMIMDHPLAHDAFINDTLEYLRQNVQIGISRGDEQQIEQTFSAIELLGRVFLNIDYATEYPIMKTHANLASEYLSIGVESVIPHDMTDVLMEGIRLMGALTKQTLISGGANDIVQSIEKIALISCAGAAKESYRPVTLIGVRQLASLTVELLRSEAFDIKYVSNKLNDNFQLVAKLFLTVPDPPLANIHGTYLGPYYSCTGTDTLQASVRHLANAIIEAEADDQTAQRIIRNIEQWTHELSFNVKEIFLLSMKKHSQLTFHIIHWIADLTKILIAVANAPACDDHTRDELIRNAVWLISVLSWIPDEQESVAFVESFQLTEVFFEVALDANNSDCDLVAEKVSNLLLSWAFKAGKYDTSWAILERALCGLVSLNLIREKEDSVVIGKIKENLTKGDSLDQNTRDDVAQGIREQAARLGRERFPSSHIERVMSEYDDRDRLRSLLETIADEVSQTPA